jgi:branched-chain amino acid transport system substrate-binding protein
MTGKIGVHRSRINALESQWGWTCLCALACCLLFLNAAGSVAAQGADTVTIGVVAPITGPFSFAGPQLADGIKDCMDMANQEGGINGKKIRVVVEDGQYNLEVAKAAFHRIMSEFRPLAMYGESTALGEAMASDITNRYKILYSSTSFSGSLAFGSVNSTIFVPGPTYGDQFGILIKYIAAAKPGAKIAFFHSDSPFGNEPLKYGRWICDRMKLHLVAEEVAKVGATDISAQMKNLKEKNPDYVILHGFVGAAPVPALIQQCRDLGMKCQFMGTFWDSNEILMEKLGPLADGFLGVSPYCNWWMDDVPMIRKIHEYNAKRYPEVKSRPNAYMQGFATSLVFAEVLRRADKANKLNFEGMAEALASLKDFQTGGLTAPLTLLNNRFPVGRIWRINAEKGRFEPASDWIHVR